MTDSSSPFLPERVEIDAFGRGGFRFGGFSHQGSLLILPSGMRRWHPTRMSDLSSDDFTAVFAEAPEIDFFLLGTGRTMQRPPPAIRSVFEHHNLRLDFMDTGAAIAIYNVVLAERRAVAAGFLAVNDGG